MATPTTRHPSYGTPFAQRAEQATHPLTAYLFRLMEAKQSNLCLSADVTTARALLQLADRAGPSIVVLKTHYDLVSGWDYHPQTGTGAQLAALARKHGFLLFEDRKFADIGKTVQQQYTAGTARIIDWAHLVTVNMDAGPAAVAALEDAAAHWRERVHCDFQTSVTVGTPTGTATPEEGEEEEEGGEKKEGAEKDQKDEDKEARERRKGSIVSITTVTQSYGQARSSTPGPQQTGVHAGGKDAGANNNSSSGGNNSKTPAVFAGLEEEAPLDRGILLLAQMSSKGNLMGPTYTQACVEAARAHKTFVAGFIAQQSLNTLPDDAFVHLTPGCKLPPPEEDGDEDTLAKGDGLGQQYNTPDKLIGQCGSDIVIVGRGILQAADPTSEAERYRRKAWKAYLARLPSKE